ncbi:STAS domain-containing protein [Streptomyces sp. NPDC055051]
MAEAENDNFQRPMPGQLVFTTSTTPDGIHIAHLSGEIDHVTAAAFRESLEVPGPAPRIVADLSRISFMDSSGINIIISTHRDLTRAGGWLRLAAPSPAVQRTITIVGLEAVVDCRPVLAEALTG